MCRWLVTLQLLLAPSLSLALTSDATMQSFALSSAESGVLTVEFDCVPSAGNIDGVVGIAASAVGDYDDMAAIIRFNDQGFIDARDGDAYGPSSVSYSAAVSYQVRMEIRVPTHDYSIYVTPEGGDEQVVGRGYAFRTPQAQVTQLGYWGTRTEFGTMEVSDPLVSFSQSLRQYEVRRAAELPTIDGDPREYMQAPPIDLTVQQTGTTAQYRLLWNDVALYVVMQVEDTELEAPHTSSDDPLWDDDSLELLLDPLHDHGEWWLADDHKVFVTAADVQRTRHGPDDLNIYTVETAVVLDGTLDNAADQDGGYVVEVAIPWSTLGVDTPAVGAVWGMELMVNDRHGGSADAAIWSNNTPPVAGPNDPDGWGDLIFSDSTVGNSDDGGFFGAIAAGCNPGEYYDLVARRCVPPSDLSCGGCASAQSSSWILWCVVGLLGRFRRKLSR